MACTSGSCGGSKPSNSRMSNKASIASPFETSPGDIQGLASNPAHFLAGAMRNALSRNPDIDVDASSLFSLDPSVSDPQRVTTRRRLPGGLSMMPEVVVFSSTDRQASVSEMEPAALGAQVSSTGESICCDCGPNGEITTTCVNPTGDWAIGMSCCSGAVGCGEPEGWSAGACGATTNGGDTDDTEEKKKPKRRHCEKFSVRKCNVALCCRPADIGFGLGGYDHCYIWYYEQVASIMYCDPPPAVYYSVKTENEHFYSLHPSGPGIGFPFSYQRVMKDSEYEKQSHKPGNYIICQYCDDCFTDSTLKELDELASSYPGEGYPYNPMCGSFTRNCNTFAGYMWRQICPDQIFLTTPERAPGIDRKDYDRDPEEGVRRL